MHPAPSVILFTVFSGLGFGLLAFLGLGLPLVTGWVAFVFYAIGFALAGGGLLASTFHLGNPQRALKAFSQWRTSWLSREAWLAVIALLASAAYAVLVIFTDRVIAELGWVAAIFAALTVFSTSMIYAQLKTVPRWHSVLTPLHLLSLSAAGGALLAAQVSLAFWVMLGAGATQILYWLWGDYALHRSGSTTATATQLGDNTRAFEPPHTGSNYLTKEMVYVVARKHRYKLRLIALGLGYILPLILLGMTGDAHLFGFLAVLSHAIGVSVSRWLFFAEAEHVVGLYYGLR